MQYEEKFIPNLPKLFEDVYGNTRFKEYCKIEKVSNDIDVDEKVYQKMMHSIFKKYQETTFDFLVKYYWLSQKFCYNGRLRKGFKDNGCMMDTAFGLYMRQWVGYNNRGVSVAGYTKINSYIDDFFPNLMAENPFEKKMKYPYKYMKFECLQIVSDMPERLDILAYGEQKKMSLVKFVDYVCNYISVINQETGKDIFSLGYSYYSKNPHVKYNLKNMKYDNKQNKTETSDIRPGIQQLPSSKLIPTKPITESNGNNPEPAGVEKVGGA